MQFIRCTGKYECRGSRRKPGETALQVQPANKSLGVVIRSAIWLGKGKAKAITATASIESQLENTKTEQAAKNKKSAKPLTSEIRTDVDKSEPEQKEKPIPSLVADAENEEDKALLPATPAPEKPASLVEAEIKTLGDAEELVITLGIDAIASEDWIKTRTMPS